MSNRLILRICFNAGRLFTANINRSIKSTKCGEYLKNTQKFILGGHVKIYLKFHYFLTRSPKNLFFEIPLLWDRNFFFNVNRSQRRVKNTIYLSKPISTSPYVNPTNQQSPQYQISGFHLYPFSQYQI